MTNHQPIFISFKQLFFDLVLIIVGSVFCAAAVNGILVPKNFVTGGVTGISIVLNRLLPAIDLGWMYLILNIPLFIMAWMAVGRRFFFYSIIGTISLTVSLMTVSVTFDIEDKILSSLLAGLILGVGAGMSLRSSGSQGGTDILSVMLLKRFSIGIGSTILGVNALVLLLVSIFYSIEAVLYTFIVLFVSSKMISIVVNGFSQRKAVFIISKKWEEISREVLKDIRRGVTIVKGEGGYSRMEEHILYVVVPLIELGELKRLILDIDPNAFVVVNDTLEVINYRIGNQPHW